MITKVLTGAVAGIDGFRVEAEIDISQGLPSFDIVGLPDSTVRESKERVRLAIKNSGLEFPVKRITVNLAPADIKKEGASFELPIAAGLLQCLNLIPQKNVRDTFFTGELSLDGSIKPVKGVLSMVHSAYTAGTRRFIVPYGNREEAALISGAQVVGVRSLQELIGHFKGNEIPAAAAPDFASDEYGEIPRDLDFANVRGQESIKRALEIAVSGNHNILIVGPPGTGKSMLANRIPYLMPKLNFEESIQVTKIYSVAGLIHQKGKLPLITDRPFRNPLSTISQSAMSGGASHPRPGEISLSHKGVLFLDELPEFRRDALEVLRQPMEDGKVTISRVSQTVTFPSEFMLVASMNPCPCGNLFNGDKCTCKQSDINRYLNKISGPLLDRIDLHVETAPVDYEDISNKKGETPESSSEIKKRVIAARKTQERRYADEPVKTNAQLTPSMVEKYCPLDSDGDNLLKSAFDTMGLSVRGYHKILKIARTIADLDQSEQIDIAHVAEAIQYRDIKDKYWR